MPLAIIHPGLMNETKSALREALKTIDSEIQTVESNKLANELHRDYQSNPELHARHETQDGTAPSTAPQAVNALDKETLALCRVVLNSDKTALNSQEYHQQVTAALDSYGQGGRVFSSSVNPGTKAVMKAKLGAVLDSEKYTQGALKEWDAKTETSYAMMGAITAQADQNYKNYLSGRRDMADVALERRQAEAKDFKLELDASEFPSDYMRTLQAVGPIAAEVGVLSGLTAASAILASQRAADEEKAYESDISSSDDENGYDSDLKYDCDLELASITPSSSPRYRP